MIVIVFNIFVILSILTLCQVIIIVYTSTAVIGKNVIRLACTFAVYYINI